MITYNSKLLFSLLFILSLCYIVEGIVPKVAQKIQEELEVRHTAISEHTIPPSFGLDQLQHTANMLHALWHNGEGIIEEPNTIPMTPRSEQRSPQREAWHHGGIDEFYTTTVSQPSERAQFRDYNENTHGYPTITQIQREQRDDKREEELGALLVAADTPATKILCITGTPYYAKTVTNTCAGQFCSVEEAICTNSTNGESYYIYPNATTVRGFPWSQCEVTRMMCLISGRYESYNMKEQFGVSNCSVIPTSIYCAMISHTYTCNVQVTCSNYTNWGWYAWGLQCTTDKLYCGSTSVSPSWYDAFHSLIVNGQCHVEQQGCAESNAPFNCSKLNYTCGFSEDLGMYNGCPQSRFNVNCANSSALNTNCQIYQLNCNGNVVPANYTYENQSACSVHSVSCGGVVSVFDEPSCVPSSMTCNGTFMSSFKNYNGPLSLCRIDQLNCASGNVCKGLQLSCADAPKCKVVELPCSVQCYRPLNNSYCVCPDDYTGEFCDTQVQFNCSLSLTNPTPHCIPSPLGDPKDYLLDGDRKCTIVDYKSNISLGYEVDCEFAYPDKINRSVGNFTYWAKNNKISISSEVAWAVRYKIFNFERIFDMGGTMFSGNLTAAQILGNELLWFNFSLPKVPDRFWFARRLYYELRFNPGPIGTVTALRGFLDAPDRPISTKTMSTMTTTKLVMILGGIAVFLGLVGYITYKCYRTHKNKQTAKKY